jgi:hypothetical protein
MTNAPSSSADDGSAFEPATRGAQGIFVRVFGWGVGGILGVVGAVTTISELIRHDHGIGPYVLAGGFLLMFLAAFDMWRLERVGMRKATRWIRRLRARVDRQEKKVQDLEYDRDQWKGMQAEEVWVNRRLAEKLQRAQRPPQVSGGTAGVASTAPPRPPIVPRSASPIRRPAPRHQVRRPPDNQPRLFDRDEEQ